jgi:hypothetical protein
MALIIITSDPSGLLASIKKAIVQKTIDTWTYDKDGDFTHTPEQWYKKAWLRPKILPGELQFGLLGQENIEMLKLIYGVYHGRFIEMLLTHFDVKFSIAKATSKKTTPDNFK